MKRNASEQPAVASGEDDPSSPKRPRLYSEDGFDVQPGESSICRENTNVRRRGAAATDRRRDVDSDGRRVVDTDVRRVADSDGWRVVADSDARRSADPDGWRAADPDGRRVVADTDGRRTADTDVRRVADTDVRRVVDNDGRWITDNDGQRVAAHTDGRRRVAVVADTDVRHVAAKRSLNSVDHTYAKRPRQDHDYAKPSTSGKNISSDDQDSRKRTSGPSDVIEPPPTKRVTTDDGKKFICEACNVHVARDNWSRHVKSDKHRMNSDTKPAIVRKRPSDTTDTQELPPAAKRVTDDGKKIVCEVCNVNVTKHNWSRHLKSPKHQLNLNPQPAIEKERSSSIHPPATPQNTPRATNKPASNRTPRPRTSTVSAAGYESNRKSVYLPSTERPSPVPRPSQRTQPTPPPPRRVTRASIARDSSEIQPMSLKISCPICGKRVLVSSMKRHQQSSERCKHSYEIVETKTYHVKKYATTGVDYRIKVNIVTQVEPAINRMIEMAKEKGNYRQGDRVIVVASHPDFRHDISLSLNNSNDETSKARAFMDHVERILTSNDKIDIRRVQWNVKIINLPRGQARSKRVLNLSRDVRTKRCIVRIQNKDDDGLCGARAVVTALTYESDIILDRPLSKLDKAYIRKGRRLQTELAYELCDRLGYYGVEGFTLQDFANVERLLNIQVKIVCCENLNSIIYEGPSADTIVYLYKNGNHFDVIKSMQAFLGSSYYCTKCDTPYNNKSRVHRCKKTKVCSMCMRQVHNERLPTVYCEDCNRYCYNADCLTEHRLPGGVCETVYKCETCNRIRERDTPHSCAHYYCRNCDKCAKFDSHLCYMTPKQQKGGRCGCRYCLCIGGGVLHCESIFHRCSYTEKYLFFDYEANQESGVHEPNYIHVQDFYGDSWDFPDNNSFCNWLISDDHRGYTCIAHNAKGYDSHFILRYCVENTIKPYTIYTGSKLTLLEIRDLGLKVIDSMNFVASPLSAFPKTFGLTELKKGFFPHWFNTVRNQTYVGPVPDQKYYSPDTMSPETRKEFLKWHAERRSENYVFDFRKELEEYCKSDVDILRRGCLELRKQFLEIANIDPFQYLTIAGVCMAIYRSKYLRPETLAVVKTDTQEPNYSKESIAWLSTFEDENIVHALNGGEATICGAKVDGYSAETKTVYQFHGCFWHGCIRCYEPTMTNSKSRHTMGDLYNKTTERTKQLREAGYEVVEMWECQWLPQYRRMRVKPRVVDEKLNPRNAFYGGRTNACKLRVTGHKMRYIDVVSLYPTVMFYDRYPIGHPLKIVSPHRYNTDWFGLVKCKILAPRCLYHPVLPVRGKKLMFTLCRQCAEDKSTRCAHDVEDRALTGTWTTVEINKALEKGYKILHVYEVWHFEKSSNRLFNGYVRDFLRIKLETSPWQKDYATLQEYTAAIRNSVGIELDDPTRIEDNPGKRAVAKICLNSLWGKFGQRQNLKQTKYVTDAVEFYKVLLDDRLEKTNIVFVNENVVQLTYHYKEHFVEDPNKINIFVAAFTTSHARMRLYAMMERLGESVVYYDTDSIVYIDDGNNTVPTGSMLGEWSDELGAEDHIDDWVSTGPKSYAYETVKRKGKCKIKGFTLNYRNSQKLNMATMKSLLECEIDATQIVYNQIGRDNVTKKLVNKTVSKRFKMDYDKRMIVEKMNRDNDDDEEDDTVDTLPWGY